MNASRVKLRRLILGMSLEDAQSKFDSPQARSLLRVSHERHNQGIFHELQLAQQQRNKIPSERKCHISRFAKPSVKGFQGYLKETPDDFVVVELWETPKEGPSHSTSNGEAAVPHEGVNAERAHQVVGGTSLSGANGSTSALATQNTSTVHVSAKIASERSSFSRDKETVLETLRDALDNVKNNVLVELTERRQSGTSIVGQQSSVVERLVGEVNESSERGYRTLSSSSHLLEPVEMELTLFAKKDRDVADAFKSPLLSVPAKEGDISYSLWVAGGLIADDETASEFPYHIAKYVVVDGADKQNPNRLPRVDVEVYFSPELYQLQRTIGKPGVVALRKFVGTVMMRQHEPTPTSASLLLNASHREQELMNLYNPDKAEAVRIPWIRKTRSRVSTLTGIALSVEDAVEESATMEKMRESVDLVWRAWGHLIKDLHVHGDLDYLYVSIDRRKEVSDNNQYIAEVRLLGQKAERGNGEGQLTLPEGGCAVSLEGRRKRSSPAKPKEPLFSPLPVDFTVIECFLERKGLPHNMVMEDITETLTEMQARSLEMMRLAVLEEAEQTGDGAGAAVVPVLYAPKVVVSHAGVIENRTHSFQRVRIRGSTLAHVEALIAAINDGDYFTSRAEGGPVGVDGGATAAAASLNLPKNLTFSATHEPQTALLLRQSQRVQGHQSLSSADLQRDSGMGEGRFRRHQVHQALDFMVVSDDERAFWREHYYRLSEPKVLFQDRVDLSDLVAGPDGGDRVKKPSPRLLEHLSIVSGKLTGQGSSDDGGKGGRGKKAKKRGGQKRAVDVAHIPTERMFEYLCTDVEAETSQLDLRVGDCLGYAYKVSVRRIPAKHTEQVPLAANSVAAKGFINYFGPNRFATYTKMNMHPGLHLLKGEFRAAAQIIVQQFYIDAAMEAEKKRTGSAFPQPFGLNGAGGFHLNDFAARRGGGGRRSVVEHGTAMQRVLSNALQATLLMAGIDGDADAALEGADDLASSSAPYARSPARVASSSPPQQQQLLHSSSRKLNASSSFSSFTDMIETDPCADAFLNVIGPNACHILIHEFLAFVWNDIVNQRLQRYGTFAILPGDLVRRHPHAPRGSQAYGELTYATRRDIQTGQRTHADVVLPIPGANIQLPDNHTSDLYVVTLKRMGLGFNGEMRQWECFYPRLWQPQQRHHRHPISPSGSATTSPADADGGGGAGVPLTSPYRFLSTSYQLMEEELGFQTPFTEPLPRYLSTSMQTSGVRNSSNAEAEEEVFFDPEADSLAAALTGSSRVGKTSLFDAAGLRPDLQRQHGNPLNLLVEAGYRQPLFLPGGRLRWEFSRGAVGDPHQRWGMRCRGFDGNASHHHRKTLSSSSSPSSSSATIASNEVRRMAALPVGSYIPGDKEANRPPQLVLPHQSSLQASFSSSSSSLAWTAADGTPSTSPPPQQQQQQQQPASLVLRHPPLRAPVSPPSRWRDRRLPIPKVPYWLPQHNDACLTLDFQLPTGVYPSMLLRELTKLDVNSPDVVDISRAPSRTAAVRDGSWAALTTDQQETYRKYLTKRRQRSFMAERPQAVSLALLHQQIFRSGGIRGSLIPTLRSYDSVSK